MLDVLTAWQFWTVIGAYAVLLGVAAIIDHMRGKDGW